MWSASFLLIYTMWALALLMELDPHKDRAKFWQGCVSNPPPSCLITAAISTELNARREQVVEIEDVKFTAIYKYTEGLRYCKSWP